MNLKNYNKHIPKIDFSPVINFITREDTLKIYKKGETFLELNSKCNFMGYAISGVFRNICFTPEGENKIVRYSFTNSFVGNYPTFINKATSNIEIQTVRDSSVYVITYNQLMQFFESYSVYQNLRTQLAETLLIEMYDIFIFIYTMTPKEQYLYILNRCPDLLDNITQKELSSLLRITSETLSRIRK